MDFDHILNRRNTNTWKWDGEGKDALYPMGTADMDFPMPPEIQHALQEKISQGILSYAADKSYFADAVVSYLNKRDGLQLNPKSVTPGTSLMSVYKLLLDAFSTEGDGVILQTPVFGGIFQVTKNNNRKIYENQLVFDEHTKTWHVNMEELEQLCSLQDTKVLVITNPGNPTANVFTKEELEEMVRITSENDVVIISDEVHSDLYYDDRKHTSILNVTDRAVLLTSSAKVFGIPGLKTAITIIPDEERFKAFALVNMRAKMDIIDLGLVGMSVGYTRCKYFIDELRAYLQRSKDICVDWFEQHDIKVTLSTPQASYLFWLDFRKWNLDNTTLESLLRKYGIVFSNGVEFGGSHNEGYMRMNVATSHAQLLAALNVLEKCYQENIGSLIKV